MGCTDHRKLVIFKRICVCEVCGGCYCDVCKFNGQNIQQLKTPGKVYFEDFRWVCAACFKTYYNKNDIV